MNNTATNSTPCPTVRKQMCIRDSLEALLYIEARGMSIAQKTIAHLHSGGDNKR